MTPTLSTTNNSFNNPLVKMPKSTSSEQTLNRLVSLFSLICGSYTRIVQSSVNELYDMVCERKDLFRHSVKFNLNRAMETADALVEEFMSMAKETNGDYLWIDTTSAIEHSVLNDINILFLTVDNILLKNKVKEDKIEAQTIVSYNLSAMMLDVFDNFCKIARGYGVNLKVPIIDMRYGKRMNGITMAMHAVAECLVSDPHAAYLREGELIHRGLEVIALKVANIDYINKVTEDVLTKNGVSYNGERNNLYLPWTAIQDNLLRKYFNGKDFTLDELALMVGRSVGAVKRRASRLGINKTKKT